MAGTSQLRVAHFSPNALSWLYFNCKRRNRHAGHALITFPEGAVVEIPRFSVSDLVRLLELYRSVGGDGLTLLANLQHGCTEEGLRMLMDTFDTFECNRRRSISSVILLKPECKKKLKFVYSRISNKTRAGRVLPVYQVHLLSGLDELHQMVDTGQLTVDYGGSLQFNHLSWLDFHRTYLPVIDRTETLKLNMQTIRDGVTALIADEDRELSSEAICYKMKEIRAKYECIFEKYTVQDAIEKCGNALKVLEHPEEDVNLGEIHSALLIETASILRHTLSGLEAGLTEIDSAFTKREADLVIRHKLQECKEQSIKVQKSVTLMYGRLQDLPVVGQNTKQAEMYRVKFQTLIREPSKSIVSTATAILLDLDTGKSTSPGSFNKALEIAKGLTEVIQPFTSHLNRLNEIYINVHVFHAVLDKTIRWKSKSLVFIKKHFGEMDTDQGEDIPTPDQWEITLDRFHHKHPPPRRKHLTLLTRDVPRGLETRLTEYAQQTAERTRFIRKFLNQTVFSTEDVTILVEWMHTDCQPKPYCIDIESGDMCIEYRNGWRDTNGHHLEEVSLI